MDYKKIRKNSIQLATALDYQVNENLPLLDVRLQKEKRHVVTRALILNCIIAVSYGFDKKKALNWLNNEHLMDQLTKDEIIFLDSRHIHTTFKQKVESLWALVWSLNFFQ